MKIEFNINNYVEFELTKYGAKILNDIRNSYIYAYPDVEVFKETKIVKAANKFQKLLKERSPACLFDIETTIRYLY